MSKYICPNNCDEGFEATGITIETETRYFDENGDVEDARSDQILDSDECSYIICSKCKTNALVDGEEQTGYQEYVRVLQEKQPANLCTLISTPCPKCGKNLIHSR